MSGLVVFYALIVIAVIVFSYQRNEKYKAKKAELIEVVILPALNAVFGDVHYSEKMCISEDIVETSGMVGAYDTFRGGDFVSATYKGLHIEMSDIFLQRMEKETYTDSDGKEQTRVTYVTVFQGLWLICDFGRKIASRLTLSAEGIHILKKSKNGKHRI
jgi:hypothetical protein